jgi:hypothetical protein
MLDVPSDLELAGGIDNLATELDCADSTIG